MSTTVARPARRTARVIAAVIIIGATLLGATRTSSAADGFVKGSATADASSFGLAIKQGAAAVGINWGASSTSYREGYAAASAKPLDMQLVRLLLGEASRCSGDTSPVPFPDKILPPDFSTNSLAQGAGTPVSGEALFPGIYDTPSPGPVGRGEAIADASPASTASVKANTINLILMRLINPATSASTRLVGTTRIATATSTFEQIEFLWGAMTIENPTWTATVKTGGETVHEGTFTVSGGTLWGQKRTAQEAMADLEATSEFVALLLGYVGLALDMPKTSVSGDFVSVSPLTLHLTDSPLGKEILAPFFAAPTGEGKPTLDEEIRDALDKWASEACDNKRYRQIAEIVLGLLKGAGALELPIGGASAGTDATAQPEFDFDMIDEPIAAVEGEYIEPTYTDELDTSSYDDSSSYGYDDYSYDDSSATEETVPEAPADETTEAGDDVVEFAAPISNKTKPVPGVTGGAGVTIGAVMIALAAAGIVSERVLKARRLRRMGS